MGSCRSGGPGRRTSDCCVIAGLTPEQHLVARLLFGLPEAAGYALAGGTAIVALGLVDRYTRDIDAFVPATPGASAGDVTEVVEALILRLGAAGWEVTVIRQHATFCRLLADRSGGSIEVDLAVDSPPLFDLVVVDGIPVLSPGDLAARKVLAIIDRAEGRDFTDLWALSRSLGRDTCVELAMRLDAGVARSAIADSFGALARLSDEELPCEPSLRDLVRRDFEAWRTELSGQSGGFR